MAQPVEQRGHDALRAGQGESSRGPRGDGVRRGAHQDLVAADVLVGREFLARGLRPRVEEQLDEHLGLRGHPSTREATTGAVAAIWPAASGRPPRERAGPASPTHRRPPHGGRTAAARRPRGGRSAAPRPPTRPPPTPRRPPPPQGAAPDAAPVRVVHSETDLQMGRDRRHFNLFRRFLRHSKAREPYPAVRPANGSPGPSHDPKPLKSHHSSTRAS